MPRFDRKLLLYYNGGSMDVLIRWACPCPESHPRKACRFCHGKKYLEGWFPIELARYMTGGKHIIIARRKKKISPQDKDVA
jgi:hypothetical protein